MSEDWREWLDFPKGEWPREEDEAAEKEESAMPPPLP